MNRNNNKKNSSTHSFIHSFIRSQRSFPWVVKSFLPSSSRCSSFRFSFDSFLLSSFFLSLTRHLSLLFSNEGKSPFQSLSFVLFLFSPNSGRSEAQACLIGEISSLLITSSFLSYLSFLSSDLSPSFLVFSWRASFCLLLSSQSFLSFPYLSISRGISPSICQSSIYLSLGFSPCFLFICFS